VETLRRTLKDYEADVIDETYGADVIYVTAVPIDAADRFTVALADRTSGRAVVEKETNI
jgi:hypothetical protein